MSDVFEVMPTKIIDNSAILLYYIADNHLDKAKGRAVQQKIITYLSELEFVFDEGNVKHKVHVGEGYTLRDYNVHLQNLLERNCPSKGECEVMVLHPYLDIPLKYVLAYNDEGKARIRKGILKVKADPRSKCICPIGSIVQPGPFHLSNLLGVKGHVDLSDLLYTRGASDKLVSNGNYVHRVYPVTKVTVKVSDSDRNKLEAVMTYDVEGMLFDNLDDLYIKVAASAFFDCNQAIKYASYVTFVLSSDGDKINLPTLECHRSFNMTMKRWLKSICFM